MIKFIQVNSFTNQAHDGPTYKVNRKHNMMPKLKVFRRGVQLMGLSGSSLPSQSTMHLLASSGAEFVTLSFWDLSSDDSVEAMSRLSIKSAVNSKIALQWRNQCSLPGRIYAGKLAYLRKGSVVTTLAIQGNVSCARFKALAS